MTGNGRRRRMTPRDRAAMLVGIGAVLGAIASEDLVPQGLVSTLGEVIGIGAGGLPTTICLICPPRPDVRADRYTHRPRVKPSGFAATTYASRRVCSTQLPETAGDAWMRAGGGGASLRLVSGKPGFTTGGRGSPTGPAVIPGLLRTRRRGRRRRVRVAGEPGAGSRPGHRVGRLGSRVRPRG